MDITLLKTFIAVAETGSFSVAAERLFVTQPAISKRIAALESELEAVNSQAAAIETGAPAGGYSVEHSTIQQLLNDDNARAILEKSFPGMLEDPRLAMAAGMTLKQVAPFAPQILTEEKLSTIDEELAQL